MTGNSGLFHGTIGDKADRGICSGDMRQIEICEMAPNTYQREALKTASPLSTATPDNLLLQGVMGMCGEAGECMDLVKKLFFHGHDLDKEHLAKELGDVLWYVATTADAIGYPLEKIMIMNVEKLQARYGDHFTTEASQHRKAGDI